MIIAVTNLKGGVGKTTTAMHLAAVVQRSGTPVVVLDADSEKSALEWAATGELSFEVKQADPDKLARQAKGLEARGGVVVIDGPPNSRDLLWSAASVADRIVVPISPYWSRRKPVTFDARRTTRHRSEQTSYGYSHPLYALGCSQSPRARS